MASIGNLVPNLYHKYTPPRLVVTYSDASNVIECTEAGAAMFFQTFD